MAEPPVELDGIRATQSADDPALFIYDPGDPEPERDPRGDPTFQVLWLGDGAFLQLGVRWGAGAERLEALRQEIARRLGERAAAVRLSPLAATVEEVRLELSDGAGGFRTIASSTASGAPPFTALFHVRLDADQTVLATEAAAGRQGRLRVTYRLSLPGTTETELLLHMKERRPGAASRLETAVRRTEPTSSSTERSTDIGSWFTATQGKVL
jgi:hypothetical protein